MNDSPTVFVKPKYSYDNTCQRIFTNENTITMMETSKETTKQKKTIALKDTDDNDASEEEITCPLFMTGLPKDFTSNPGLSAIASLLEEDEEEQRVRHPIVRNTNVPKKNIHKNRGWKSSKNETSPSDVTLSKKKQGDKTIDWRGTIIFEDVENMRLVYKF